MAVLNIQLHPARSPQLDVAETIAWLCELAAGARVSEGDEGGPYINIAFDVVDLTELWTLIRNRLRTDVALAPAAIVVCQGRWGWNDYRLLHHFDPTVPLNEAD